jgi:hypothetical protein
MQFSVRDAFNASAEIAASSHYPNLRLATVAMVTANEPRDDAPSKPSTSRPVWAPSSPAAINPNVAFSWPSAVCYFFGRSLYIEKGGKIPIGLVGSDWGGQRVEAFSSPDALNDKTCGGTQPYADGNAYRHRNGSQSPDGMPVEDLSPWQQPGVNPGPMQLWYAMIYPLINMRFRGAAWWQGEANDGQYASCEPAFLSTAPYVLHLVYHYMTRILQRNASRLLPLSRDDCRLAEEDGPRPPVLFCPAGPSWSRLRRRA